MAKSRAGFVYQGRDRQVEDVVRRSKQAGSSFDGYLDSNIPMFKAKEGDVEVRILPPTWDVKGPWGDGWHIEIYLHYDVGPDGGAYLCLDKMKGETCPICEARRAAVDDEEANALKPSWRALCWVVDRNNEKAGPQVWSLPPTLFREINGRSVDKKTEEVILIDDPENGYDVLFTREGAKLRTKYGAVEITRDPCPIHDDERQQDKWLAYIEDNPLPDVLQFYDAEHIERVLFGKSERRRRGDDDEAEDTRGARGSRRRSSVVDEEAETTTRRSRRSAPEDEDTRPSRHRHADGEQLETDEPAPRRSRRAAVEPEEPEEPISSRAARAASRGRSRDDADEDVVPRRRLTRGADPEPEDDEPAPRRSRRAAAEPDEGEEPELTRPARGARRGRQDPEPEEPDETPAPSRRARGALDRARARA